MKSKTEVIDADCTNIPDSQASQRSAGRYALKTGQASSNQSTPIMRLLYFLLACSLLLFVFYAGVRDLKDLEDSASQRRARISKRKKAEYQRLLQQFDSNGDGELKGSELGHAHLNTFQL